ncbi:MAG TPA: aminotransferase class IV [Cyclobacteriaceae bacterium]|nr:aminotransferase class IV [Cyclobacteriaceae bacterium]
MSLFIETIKIVDGQIKNLPCHHTRFNHTRQSFFPETPALDLGEWIKIPKECTSGIFRCRVTYGEEIENIEFEKYSYPKIRSLKLVYDDDIEYSFKYKNRFQLSGLLRQRGDCDEIIIVKHRRLTDTTFSNLVFLSGGAWYSPQYPLLKGTKREMLLDEAMISESDIFVSDLPRFEKAGLINAMIELNELTLDIGQIH